MTDQRSLNILLVDDEEIVHQTLAPYLNDSGHNVEGAREGKNALEMIREKDYDLALVDVRMPGMDGLSVLSRAAEASPDLSVVIMTGHGNMELAIQALRLGAADFLTKPVKLAELDAVLEKASRFHDLKKNQRRLRETLGEIQALADDRERGRRMIAESQAMKEVREKIKMAVEANLEAIMISGETGTGKEVVAREIHFLDPRSDQSPFIAVSCPALPDTLVESELFGHVKGSFTGATADKAGCFELADGGTLFLDEVGELSAAAQAKLLRVLETRSVRRVGGNKEVEVDVKVITATNRELEEMVEAGKFRQDLFYRLNVFSVDLKPLRERKEDIMPLAEHFLESFSARSGFEVNGFSDQAREIIINYPFPGNARELRNIVQCAAILCRKGLIKPEHLNLPKSQKPASPSAPTEDDEKDMLIAALEKAKWNRRQAAEELDMPYSTFRYRMRKLGID